MYVCSTHKLSINMKVSMFVRRVVTLLVSLFMHFHGNLLHERFPTESILFKLMYKYIKLNDLQDYVMLEVL